MGESGNDIPIHGIHGHGCSQLVVNDVWISCY